MSVQAGNSAAEIGGPGAPLLVLAAVPLPDRPARQRSGGRCLEASGRVRNTSAPGWVAGANPARGFRCRRG